MNSTEAPRDIDRLCAQLAAIAEQLLVAACRTQEDDGVVMRGVGSALGATDRITAAVIGLLQQTSHRGVIGEEGMTTGTWLRTHAARTAADERMLTLAADRLSQMPAVSAWFADGTLSWSTVRGIVAATRNLTEAQRAWVDATLADDRQRVLRLDPDQIVEAVERLADRARPDLHAAREQRNHERQFLSVQPRFDGTSRLVADLDAEATATVLAALDAVDVDDGEPGADDSDDWRQKRCRSNAAKLVAIAQTHLGGGTGRRARPSMLVITDIAALRDGGDAPPSSTQLLWTLHHSPVELTPRAAQRLACDATLRHVLVDGSAVLGATAAHPNVSATLRAALVARDGGCRFPSCRAPVARCDNHHVVPCSQGGPTVLENLALLCEGHHHAVHDSGWVTDLHADGAMTFTRRGVTLQSSPRGDRRFEPSPPPAGRPRRPRRPPPGGQRTAVPAARNADPQMPASTAVVPEPLPF